MKYNCTTNLTLFDFILNNWELYNSIHNNYIECGNNSGAHCMFCVCVCVHLSLSHSLSLSLSLSLMFSPDRNINLCSSPVRWGSSERLLVVSLEIWIKLCSCGRWIGVLSHVFVDLAWITTCLFKKKKVEKNDDKRVWERAVFAVPFQVHFRPWV